MITFSYPALFFLLPIILLIWYGFFREKIGYTPPNNLVSKYLKTPFSVYVLWCIRASMALCITLILMGIHIDKNFNTDKEITGTSTVIVLDISLSMLAEDVPPNRIEKAKEIIHTFLTREKWEKIGLIVFAGKPIVLSPFSTDTSGIENIVKNISPYMIRQEDDWLSGTAIGDAILLAEKMLETQTGRRDIILITDGRANVWINPKDIVDNSVIKSTIFTIGIGKSGTGDLFYTNREWKKQFLYDGSGNILKTDIDSTSLGYIAGKTKGKYFSGELSDILSTSPKDYKNPVIKKDIPLTWYIIFICIILFIAERGLVIWIVRNYLWNKGKEELDKK